MPTAIAVTSPDLALPATDRQTPAAVVLQAPHLQPLDEALTETSAVLEHHGHIVALYSSACPPAHIRRLHTLRAVLESDRIAIVPLSLPPLGVAVLARQLRQLSLCDFSPGVLASAARLLSHYLHAGALLGSVGGLDHIEVDLRSHVKSWLPGVHFAVLAHPAPRLLQLDRHGGGAGLPAPGFTTQLALARGQFTGDWVSDTLAPAWQVQGVFETRLPAESAEWWGTRKLVEFAAGIPDLSVLHQLVSSVLRERCGWCGLELLGDRCAFCAAPLARPRAAGGGGPAHGPAAIAAPAPRAVAEAPAALPHPPAAPSAVPDAPEAPAVHRAPAASDAAAARGPQYPPGGPVAPGNPYGSGPPVPGNPYASDGPRTPGRRDLPGQASFAGHPDLSGRPGAPGTPRTVARVR
ncbi:collagen-like triple helix repeat-containing protein [Streptomyces kronopolitis]|uniref:collagen-like triple helix repeat-containing protein n=1 Tax=Streptomyces kronopolitis TaxID=1612435 RepID=UPI001665B8B1|nr:collagen-like protein [Streptomyces kronopolitis]